MKTGCTLGVLAAVMALVVSALVSNPAQARDLYGIASLGKADTTRAADAFAPQGDEDGVNVYQLGVGYKLNSNFAAELIYHGAASINYGQSCTTTKKDGKLVYNCVGNREEVKPDGGSISVIGGLQVGGFNPYVRAGAFHSGAGTSWIAGVGVKVAFLRLEYQHIDDIETGPNGFSSDMQVLSLGVTF